MAAFFLLCVSISLSHRAENNVDVFCVFFIFRGLSLLYSQAAREKIDPTETQKNIREQLQWGPMWLLTPRRVMQYVKEISEKFKKGQPVSLTDFYGHCVGESLLGPVC